MNEISLTRLDSQARMMPLGPLAAKHAGFLDHFRSEMDHSHAPTNLQHRTSGIDRRGGETRFGTDSVFDVAGSTDETGRRDEARDAAAQFVGMALIQSILANLRETSMSEGPFAPTAVEHRFGPLMDQMLSDRISRASNFPLIDSVADRLCAAAQTGKEART